MSHLPPARLQAKALSPTVLSVADVRHTPRHRLDRASLLAGVNSHKRAILDLEIEMVAACEHAALQGAGRDVTIEDRDTWDRAMWHRYLAEATRLEPVYGPRMKHHYQSVDRLNHLMTMPLAA